jgi:type II secretory pathway pseudopilin PulG
MMFIFDIQKQKRQKSSGMVIIELIVLIAIIGLLSTAVGALYTGAQQKARDTQRFSDAAAIKDAIEMSYGEEYRYRDPDEVSVHLLSRGY